MICKVIIKDRNDEITFFTNADREMVSYLFQVYKKEIHNIGFYFKRTGYEFKQFPKSETSLKRKIRFKPKVDYKIEI